MDTIIVWVSVSLSGWFVKRKKKCTEIKKKRVDGQLIQSMKAQNRGVY
jgi:hypothetical protein